MGSKCPRSLGMGLMPNSALPQPPRGQDLAISSITRPVSRGHSEGSSVVRAIAMMTQLRLLAV